MKTRAAIAGAGLMGFWHAKNIARAGGEVAVVYDVDDGAAQHLATRFKSARASTRLEDALDRNKIDVLHICTPLSSHFAMAAAALANGIHVLIEKPMTPHCAETKRLYELAAEHRALLRPVHQFPFQRGVRRALAEFGRIGQLRHFEATFCSAGGAGSSGEELDAIVAEILPHPLSLMQLFAPGSVREEGWLVTRPAPGELRAMLTARDICFSILISMNSRPTGSALCLLGTMGTIHIDLFHGFCVIEPGAVSKLRKMVHPFNFAARTFVAACGNLTYRAWKRETAYPGLERLIRDFYLAIANGQATPLQSEEVMRLEKVRALIIENLKVTS
ncbi:MAG TPA: Gfo/Idh/MocA family oxidoreductase [Chthoniobacterales bacterium]|nr:Gfo/Idh/MocA family oxidoreductase [Chthoniobacterales bacterium]